MYANLENELRAARDTVAILSTPDLEELIAYAVNAWYLEFRKATGDLVEVPFPNKRNLILYINVQSGPDPYLHVELPSIHVPLTEDLFDALCAYPGTAIGYERSTCYISADIPGIRVRTDYNFETPAEVKAFMAILGKVGYHEPIAPSPYITCTY
jgi:hypothetical protein